MITSVFCLFLLVCFCTIQGREIPLVPNDTGRICAAGEFENGNACEPCPTGTFRNGTNPMFCVPCPVGYVSLPLFTIYGSYQPRSFCRACIKDQFQDQVGQSECKECPPNSNIPFYASKVPNANCNECPKNTVFDGSSKCYKCRAGLVITTKKDGKRTCSWCPSGSFTHQEGMETCTACGKGEKAVSSTGPCEKCAPGSFYDSSSKICKDCKEGFYQPFAGGLNCLACPQGSVSNGTGAAFCVPAVGMGGCKSGEFLKDGKCEKCAKGWVSDGGNAMACVQCVPPSFADTSGKRCVCKKGFRRGSKYDEAVCVACPQRAIGNGVNCTCPTPLYLDEQRNKCVCSPGMLYKDGKCVDCPKGVKAGDGDCDYCTKYTSVDKKTGRCVRCEQRAYGEDSFDADCTCPKGYFWFTRGTRCLCAGGISDLSKPRLPSGLPACKPCEEGFIPVRGSCGARCTLFDPPPYNSYWNGEKCVFCENGFQAIAKKCVPRNPKCEQGKSFSSVTGECECANLTAPDGTCVNCDGSKGLYASKEQGKCVCREGEVMKAGKCELCEPGYTAQEGRCVPCGGKRYKPKGERICKYCEQGGRDIVGAQVCQQEVCSADWFETKDKKCNKCDKGFRMLNGTCVECEMNQVSPGGRRAYCSICVDGTVPNADRSACV